MQPACPICSSPTAEESRFCKRHHLAQEELESAFAKWRSAYGGQLDREGFLERVLQARETGQKVREIICFLREAGRS